jgi:hypothetical protein
MKIDALQCINRHNWFHICIFYMQPVLQALEAYLSKTLNILCVCVYIPTLF